MKNLIEEYYGRFFIRFSYKKGKIRWQQLNNMITGVTVLVILFSSVIVKNGIVTAAEKGSKFPAMKSL